jgi:hypothetical protein
MGGEVRGRCRSWRRAPSEEDWSRDRKEVVPAPIGSQELVVPFFLIAADGCGIDKG